MVDDYLPPQPRAQTQKKDNIAFLPLYQCHKKVWALKIKDIRVNPRDRSCNIYPAEPTYAPFKTRSRYADCLPKPKNMDDMGYFIQYQDGYTSWSPTKAFEEGYTLIEDSEVNKAARQNANTK